MCAKLVPDKKTFTSGADFHCENLPANFAAIRAKMLWSRKKRKVDAAVEKSARRREQVLLLLSRREMSRKITAGAYYFRSDAERRSYGNMSFSLTRFPGTVFGEMFSFIFELS